MSLLIYKAGCSSIRSPEREQNTGDKVACACYRTLQREAGCKRVTEAAGKRTNNSVGHDALKTNPEFPMLDADYQIFPEKLTVVRSPVKRGF
jgi:hypothetical protein